MTRGPTQGASESGIESSWPAKPWLAWLIRAVVVLTPLVVAFLVVRLVAGYLYRPSGWLGFVSWVVQAAIVGSATSIVVDRFSRHLLPLATLYNMSLVFPDQAPSRFGIALRSGTVTKLRAKIEKIQTDGLGSSAAEAAETALELVAVMSEHDRLTRGHTERVRAYADLIGKEMGLNPGERAALAWGALLHDVGKLAVPAEILNKSGRPTNEEWEILKAHPTHSATILAPLEDWLGPWVRAGSDHHERWDGAGYPRGLAGPDISLAGRITAVADAYDVITSKRSYKEPMSAAAARRELVANSGTQFDPAAVRALVNVSLGRRWMVGPFAWLADLQVGQLLTTAISTPVVVTIGTASALAAAVTAPLPDPGPDDLAFIDAVGAIEVSVVEPVTSTVEPAGLPDLGVGTEESTIEQTTSLPDEVVTTSTTVEPSTVSSTTSSPASDLAPASTAPPSTTTAAPTTTTVATATTVAPTATTAAPTTTTTTTTVATTTTTTVATTTTTLAPTTTVPPSSSTPTHSHPHGGDKGQPHGGR